MILDPSPAMRRQTQSYYAGMQDVCAVVDIFTMIYGEAEIRPFDQ